MATSPGAVEARAPDPVGQWCERLDVRADPASIVRVAGGQSKSEVFSLEIAGARCVLKVTTSTTWRPQALRELWFYSELAPGLPIPVPELLASTVAEAGVCLLISAHGRPTQATQWTDRRWVNAATQAGELHRRCRSLELPTWARRKPGPNPAGVARAAAAWRARGHPRVAEQLPSLLVDVTSVLTRAPPTLIHGDCHVDNLLPTDETDLVWVDWQAVTTGAGPEDLALLWQRAEFDGARPPRSAMFAAYREALGATTDEVEQQVLAAELRLLLLEWPHFLPYGDARQQATVVDRFREARHEWARR